MNQIYRMEFKPVWEEVERARELCIGYLEERGFSPDAVYSVSMIASELVENAVKYGDFPSPTDRIQVNVLLNRKIIVEVLSPILEEKSAHLRRLDRIVQWIRGHQNPFESFVEKLKMVSSRPIDDPESGLGLFRIAYEGQAILDFYVDDDNTISVSAIYIPE